MQLSNARFLTFFDLKVQNIYDATVNCPLHSNSIFDLKCIQDLSQQFLSRGPKHVTNFSPRISKLRQSVGVGLPPTSVRSHQIIGLCDNSISYSVRGWGRGSGTLDPVASYTLLNLSLQNWAGAALGKNISGDLTPQHLGGNNG